MFLIDLVKAVRSDAMALQSRFDYWNWLLSGVPGDVGLLLRSKLLPRFFKRAGKGVVIMQGARFNGVNRLETGDKVYIGIDNFLQASGGLVIGDHCVLGPGVKIWTVNHRFESVDTPIMEQGYERKPVRLGAHVWLGANVFIMPGVELPDGCVVSAGSVVGAKKYPPQAIIAGNPARVIECGRRAASL